MEILTVLIAAKMSTSPLATGVYKLKWQRAWVDSTPAPKVLVVNREDIV